MNRHEILHYIDGLTFVLVQSWKIPFLGSLKSIKANQGVNYRFLGFETIAIVIAMKFCIKMMV